MPPTRVLFGDRIGQGAKLRPSCVAVIFDSERRVLLMRRGDNGQWCLPGGALEAGESATEGTEREVLEETGLRVQVRRLVGIYSSPHRIVEYPGGERVQAVSMTFEVEIIGGRLRTSAEATELVCVPRADLTKLDIFADHLERVLDALKPGGAPYLK